MNMHSAQRFGTLLVCSARLYERGVKKLPTPCVELYIEPRLLTTLA